MNPLVQASLLLAAWFLGIYGAWLIYKRGVKMDLIDAHRVKVLKLLQASMETKDFTASGVADSANKVIDGLVSNIKDPMLSVGLILIALGLVAMSELLVSLKIGS